MSNHVFVLFLVIFLAFSPRSQSWGWFSSPSEPSSSSKNPSENVDFSKGLVAEFQFDALDDPKAVQLIENAIKSKGMSPCWFRAYEDLFSSCSDIMAADEKRKRLAWHLSNCFQKDTGRSIFPTCSENSNMVDCLSNLNNDDRKIFLEFFLQTNSICQQLQAVAFKSELERLVNDLKNSAENAEDKLDIIGKKSDNLLQHSEEINESVTLIGARTHQIGQSLKSMTDDISVVLKHSTELNKQTKGIAMSQEELLEGQGALKEKLHEGMAKVQESYDNLNQEIECLQQKAVDVMKKMNQVRQEMFSQMDSLKGKTDNIATMAGISIDKQQELLQKQSMSLEGLMSLTDALKESRISVQQMVNFTQTQQNDLKKQQDQLLRANDHLASNSRSILAAQEAFESKQANMFAAIDKLFALHNAMLLESRLIKAFCIYSMFILVIYTFTCTKQTYAARCKLYLGLCVAFAIECSILRFTTIEMEQQNQLRALVKPLFGVYAIIQILHTLFTYRDYEAMNHKILISLMEKVNGMRKEEQLWEEDDVDSEIDWPSWVVDELPEEVDINEDPNYMLPATTQHIEETSIVRSTGRKYNLRRR